MFISSPDVNTGGLEKAVDCTSKLLLSGFREVRFQCGGKFRREQPLLFRGQYTCASTWVQSWIRGVKASTLATPVFDGEVIGYLK